MYNSFHESHIPSMDIVDSIYGYTAYTNTITINLIHQYSILIHLGICTYYITTVYNVNSIKKKRVFISSEILGSLFNVQLKISPKGQNTLQQPTSHISINYSLYAIPAPHS